MRTEAILLIRCNCFEMWWPGRELNPRRQPFQGCALRGKIGGSIHAASELLPQESNNFPRFAAVVAIPRRQSVPELCLQVLLGDFRIGGTERKIHAKRKHANRTTRRTRRWEFRWREPGPDGRRKLRRMVVGTTNEFDDEVAARQAIAGLHLRMNAWNERVKMRQITLSELGDHYRQRELKPDILWKTH
jgi:hypothetical protein